MPKPFYADYVNHMIRAYTVLSSDGCPTEFKTDVDAQNYESVSRVLARLDKPEQQVILDVLGSRAPLRDSIIKVATDKELSTDAVWTLVSRVSGQIAKDRRLV